MAVNYHISKLSNQNLDSFLRLDFKYHSAIDKNGWDIFQTNCERLTPLKNILIPSYSFFEYDDGFEYDGIPTGKEYLSDFGDIISVQIVTKDDHPGRLKYKANENCILISSLKGARIPALSFDFDISNYVFSNAFYIFEVNTGWSKKFVLYLLRIPKIKSLLDNSIFRGIGISAYREDDLLKILIPTIPIETQKKAVEKIEPVETEIANLKNSKLKPVDIINQVFGDEFNFDWSEFEKLKSQKIFTARLTDFANNVDCRFGYKFHNKAGKFVYDFLCSKSNKRIKDFISEPIVLGKSVSPSDYDEDGEFYYIAMSNIKSWAFDSEDCKRVTDSYSSANLNKTVQKDDILLARSGEGTIGKVALIEDEDIQGIFADFTQRIRLKNYNPRLAYYYFRSDFFQYLVYTHKKGLGNNTNIFPSQIQEFPIPDWSEEKQAEIVEKIKSQIDAQSTIDKEIENNMAKINLIIEDAISSTEGL